MMSGSKTHTKEVTHDDISKEADAVLDIDYMLTRESPLAIELVEKLEARVEAARIVNETTKVRKALDGEILQLLEDYDLGGDSL